MTQMMNKPKPSTCGECGTASAEDITVIFAGADREDMILRIHRELCLPAVLLRDLEWYLGECLVQQSEGCHGCHRSWGHIDQPERFGLKGGLEDVYGRPIRLCLSCASGTETRLERMGLKHSAVLQLVGDRTL